MKFFKTLFPLFLIGLFIGCSGDDSDINPGPQEPEEPTILTGVFLDSEVEGLTYSTETQNGVTNSEGEYNYLEGETVTFSVGDITLGSGPAGPEMTPVSITSTPNASLDTEEVKNIAAFLQSLDSDNDPSNGILIETATVDAINFDSIDFTQSIIKILGEIIAEVNLANDTNLEVVYPETAAEHLAETLGETYEAEDPVFNDFIPYLENQYGQKLNSYYWIHETNDEGQLVRSFQYEKYPHRLAYEIVYTEFNEANQPVRLEQVSFNRITGEEGARRISEIYYSKNGLPESSITTSEDYTPQGDFFLQKWYTQFDEEKRVVEFTFSRTRDTEPLTRVVHVYDEEGNRIEEISYSIESGAQTRKLVYTYTDWGDKASETLFSASGDEIAKFENFYREDRTLEKQVYTAANGATSTTNYDENEEMTTD